MSKKTTSAGGNAAGRDVRNEESNVIKVSFGERQPSAPAIVGNGNNGNIMAGGDVHITTERVVTRPRVTVTPGDGVISEEQAARLKGLIDDWVATHNAVKRAQLTHQAAWSKLNKHGKVASYRMTPSAKFPAQERWLLRQIAMIRSMRSAAAKDPTWRASRIKAIKARASKQHGDDRVYENYIAKFGKTSLTELTDDELQATYEYVLGKTPKKAAGGVFLARGEPTPADGQ